MPPRWRRVNWIALISVMLIAELSDSWATAAEYPAFVVHEIDRESAFTAAAVIDVNRDGQLDVVSGGWWHEAPSWKRHFVREVEFIRGRFDDYAHQPLDVNADGRTDLISANWRTARIHWIEQPADAAQPWTLHVVAEPGPMETARLVDINGDGRPDLLPNGGQFAAWWEIEPGVKPKWTRHEFPEGTAGHGIGFGDIDGDGRGDIVTTHGWHRQPKNARIEPWRGFSEFSLHRDGSIPMLVEDVDGDGDQDIIWARAHRTGLYWLEQSRAGDARRWTWHAIDTSWSQAHSILWVDLNGDGRRELVAGKRYMGHDGKDLGEHDPLVIAAYEFDPALRAWRRHVLAEGTRAGFGLDPKTADLDGDGDLDIVCSDRSGLCWLENTGQPALKDAPHWPPTRAPAYADHAQLLTMRDDQGQQREIGRDQWGERRAHILAHMQAVMGELPDSARRVPLDVATVSREEKPKYTLEKIVYASEPGDRVPAWLLVPKQIEGRAPAMLCLHQTTKIGKDEPTGLGGRETLHYARELAERGYVCVVPDYPSFGEYPFDFAAWRDRYASGTMKAIWNNIRAIDVLEARDDVDRDRIGVIGHSLGGHNAAFTAAFDLRLQAVITSCAFTAAHHYQGGDLTAWAQDRYMPRVRDTYHNSASELPFDFTEIIASFAPRAMFACAPLRDSNFDVAGVREVERAAREVYQAWDADDRLRFDYPDSEHDFPDAERKAAYQWLDQQFKHKPR